MTSALVQEINLLQDDLRPAADWLSGRRAGLVLAVLAVLAVLYSALNFMDFLASRAALEQARAELARLDQALADARVKYPPQARDAHLAERVARLAQEVAHKRRVLDTLSGRTFGNTRGFAGHLAGLARQRLEGVWLTGVAIRRGGTEISLTGASLDPELVPRLLQRLSREQAFAGTEFRRFLMERSEELKGAVRFRLTTRGEGVS